MDDFIKGLNEISDREVRERQEKRLNVVTTTMDIMDDTCDGHNQVTTTMDIMKYYTVRPVEYFRDRQYEEHNRMTFKKTVKDIPPRKFYRMTQLEAFIEHLHKMANRTIEDAEITLLLRHITNGRHYELVCLVPIGNTSKECHKWEDIK